jgi:hypothetical protein
VPRALIKNVDRVSKACKLKSLQYVLLSGRKIMATRATYQFRSINGQEVVMYVHHDGYPSGAAEKMEGCVFAEDFIRKNDRAEITESHLTHADTEYCYTVINGELEVLERQRFGTFFELYYQGPLDRFCRHRGREGCAGEVA